MSPQMRFVLIYIIYPNVFVVVVVVVLFLFLPWMPRLPSPNSSRRSVWTH